MKFINLITTNVCGSKTAVIPNCNPEGEMVTSPFFSSPGSNAGVPCHAMCHGLSPVPSSSEFGNAFVVSPIAEVPTLAATRTLIADDGCLPERGVCGILTSCSVATQLDAGSQAEQLAESPQLLFDETLFMEKILAEVLVKREGREPLRINNPLSRLYSSNEVTKITVSQVEGDTGYYIHYLNADGNELDDFYFDTIAGVVNQVKSEFDINITLQC